MRKLKIKVKLDLDQLAESLIKQLTPQELAECISKLEKWSQEKQMTPSQRGHKSDVIDLEDNTWTDGTVIEGKTIVYRLTVSSGETYYVNWNSLYSGDGSKTGHIYVSAYNSDGTTVFTDMTYGYIATRSITAASDGYIYLEVGLWSGSYAGSFSIRAKKIKN